MSDAPPLAPWLAEPLRQALALPRAHAVLLSSLPGLGAFEAGMALAQAWLCESAEASGRACGRCAACHLFAQRSHPDAHWLLPEQLRVRLGWQEADDKKKPSQEIRIDEVRAMLGFAQSTRARSQGKVVLIHPAEALNTVAANALLKTLEEPGGSLRFVLVSEATDALLPTIRSRCQAVPVPQPQAEQGAQWLRTQQPALSAADAVALLRASGQRPQQVLDWLSAGLTAPQLAGFARSVARAELGDFIGWKPEALIDLLQRLCSDLLRVTAGGPPQYFSADQLPKARQAAPLQAWAAELRAARRHATHPLQWALWLEALGVQAQRALRQACKANP
ncbi:DNA polymerase III subunit delta' [Inhella sp.]|uniref:DNA polymerase III subunit delta' n=1 Tax=Inhella sp. TaxID=1921806 RepID=UPI0035B3E601